MANTISSPNMNLIIPTVSVDPAPDWAGNVNSSLSIIDQHNHSAGSGVQITQAGISLTPGATTYDSLNFNSSNAYALRSVRFAPQSAALALATDLGCLYEAGVDLYYNDGNGNQIRLTSGGSIVGTAGSISGLPSGTASASYSGGTFVWQSATSTAANMDAASYILRNSTASSHGLTLNPPNAMAADYSLYLPSIPGSTSIMQLDTSGNMSASLNVDGSTLVISSNVLEVNTGGITATQIANQTITATQIANNTITGGQIQNGAITGTQITSNVALAGAPTAGGVLIITQSTASGALAIVRGTLASNGNLIEGEGITATNNASTGIYNITYTTPFASTPTAVACAQDSSFPGYYVVGIKSISTTVLTLQVTAYLTQALANIGVCFIIIGPKV